MQLDIFEHSRDVIVFVRRSDGQVLEANAAATLAYGYGRDELMRLSVRDLRADTTHVQHVQDFWVLKRVLMRARTTVPLPRLGRSFDISLLFDQYAINSGLDESLFVKASGRR